MVLVGHSYRGQVITNAARGGENVKSLVYVAAFAPEAGEAAADLAGKVPGGTLGQALAAPVKLADGGVDLSIDQAKFHDQFAHDVAADDAALMAAGQRPITEAALTEKSGDPAWKALPSYFIYGDGDKNIPAEAQGLMAERAGSRHTVVVKGALARPISWTASSSRRSPILLVRLRAVACISVGSIGKKSVSTFAACRYGIVLPSRAVSSINSGVARSGQISFSGAKAAIMPG